MLARRDGQSSEEPLGAGAHAVQPSAGIRPRELTQPRQWSCPELGVQSPACAWVAGHLGNGHTFGGIGL